MFKIQEEWGRYLRVAIGSTGLGVVAASFEPAGGTAADAVVELQSAYYAGATTIFYGLLRHLIRHPVSEPITEHDLLLMRDLHRELTSFARDVARAERGAARLDREFNQRWPAYAHETPPPAEDRADEAGEEPS